MTQYERFLLKKKPILVNKKIENKEKLCLNTFYTKIYECRNINKKKFKYFK